MRKSMVGLAGVLLFITAGQVRAQSVFRHLGKERGIEAIVEDLVLGIKSDGRINGYFAATFADNDRLANFKINLMHQICQAGDGPCVYKGKDMQAAHAGMGITAEAFNAFMEDLVASLDKYQVDEHDKSKILGAFGPMRRAIVTK